MKHQIKTLLLLVGLLSSLAYIPQIASSANHATEHHGAKSADAPHHNMPMLDMGQATHTAVASGNWSDASTWGGSMPTANALILHQGAILDPEPVGLGQRKLRTARSESSGARSVRSPITAVRIVPWPTSGATFTPRVGRIASTYSPKLSQVQRRPASKSVQTASDWPTGQNLHSPGSA